MSAQRESDRTTPNRSQMATIIAGYRNRAMNGEDQIELWHECLLEVLEPRLRDLYLWFERSVDEEHYSSLVSADVCEAWEVSKEDAATMLKALVDLGLLERAAERTATGRRYVYGLPGMAAEFSSE